MDIEVSAAGQPLHPMHRAQSYDGATMGELFVRAFHRGGDEVALIDADRRMTYRQLSDRVGRLVAGLKAEGLEPGCSLAQLSRNRIEAVVVIAAAFVLGLRYTPLHPLSSMEDIAFILEDAEIECLILDERNFNEHRERLRPHLSGRALLITHEPCESGPSVMELCASDSAGRLVSVARPADIALIVYTGGTTGRPKGVVHRHQSLVANALISMAEWDWPQHIRYLAVTPISHASLLLILPVFLKGGSISLLPNFTVSDFADAVARDRITFTFVVPTMIYAILESATGMRRQLESLETIVYGASSIDVARLQEALATIGPKFCQLYGQTEAPNAVTMLFKRHHVSADAHRLASCGQALANNDVRLLGDDGQEVALGEVGEICVRGPLVMDGYWRRPNETAEALKHGWLHTGDLAVMDRDGFLRIVDRKKDMIITGGFNVFCRDVEDAVASHPAVAQCCVVGIPHRKWGEQVSALVVLRDGCRAEAEDLCAHVKQLKGSISTPKVVHFANRMPLTALGKPDKKAVRALLGTVVMQARSHA
jgi:fatty-acyl-CoA synthase